MTQTLQPWQTDPEFVDYTIRAVAPLTQGYKLWFRGQPDDVCYMTNAGPIEPRCGMNARVFGVNRGLVIDNQVFWYHATAISSESPIDRRVRLARASAPVVGAHLRRAGS